MFYPTQKRFVGRKSGGIAHGLLRAIWGARDHCFWGFNMSKATMLVHCYRAKFVEEEEKRKGGTNQYVKKKGKRELGGGVLYVEGLIFTLGTCKRKSGARKYTTVLVLGQKGPARAC